MATIQYTAKVKDELLLELPTEAQELHLKPGDEVQIQLERNGEEATKVKPNEKALAALQEIARRQEGWPHTDGSDTQRFLREARAGAMYDSDPTE